MEVLAAPSQLAVADTEEGELLQAEAADLLSNRLDDTKRQESNVPIKNYTGDRLFKTAPRRYRLIANLRREGVSYAAICRSCLTDERTIKSVERREAESIPELKSKLTTGFGQLARMTLERLQEEVPTMNQAQLAVTAGIAADKFEKLTNEPIKVEHSIAPSTVQNVFEKFIDLSKSIESTVTKVIEAKVIESTPLTIENAP